MTTVSNPTSTTEADGPIRICTRCGVRYDWRKSPSSLLKMTYCGSLCEQADLGFTIEALLKLQPPAPAAPPPEGLDAILDEALATAEAAESQLVETPARS